MKIDEIINKIFDRQEEMMKDISEIKIEMVKDISEIKVDLKEHMRRSVANEQAIEILKEEFKPVRTHVDYVKGGLKLIGIVSLIFGIAVSIVQVIDFIQR